MLQSVLIKRSVICAKHHRYNESASCLGANTNRISKIPITGEHFVHKIYLTIIYVNDNNYQVNTKNHNCSVIILYNVYILAL